MARLRFTQARGADIRLRRCLGLLVAILIGLIVAHPGAEATASGHLGLPAAADAAITHHDRDCPQAPGHADQVCPTRSSSTAPVTATVTPPATPVFLRLSPALTEQIGGVGTALHHLRPRLIQLAVSRT